MTGKRTSSRRPRAFRDSGEVSAAPRRLGARWLVVGLLCAHYALGLTSVLRKSCSCDEIAYLTAGYTYWQTGDYRLVPEHPPLIELWASLPLNFMSLKMPSFDQPCWRESNQWQFGWQFFYELGNPLDRMLLAGRAMIGLFSVGLGLTIYLVAQRWFGAAGGLIALVLFTFSPEMLAHGFQITTDMAATLFFLLSLHSIWWAMHRVSAATILLSGLALAALFNAKLSVVLIVPVYGILLLARCISTRPLVLVLGRTTTIAARPRRLAVLAAVFALQVLIIAGGIWIAHGLKYTAFVNPTPGVDRWVSTNTESELRQPEWDYELNRAGWVAPAISFAREHRLLPEAYLYGFLYAKNMTKGSVAFLNGDRRRTGFRTYFPFTFLIKSTLPFLAILALTLATGLLSLNHRANHQTAQVPIPPIWYRALPLLVFFVIYWATAIMSPFNIGHRHILPIYPPLLILSGALATVRWRRIPIAPVTAVLLLVLHAGVSAWAWPHYLSYFNSTIGGPRNGYRHLVDSSVDWGQDLRGLADWLHTHNPPQSPNAQPVYLSYLGNGNPEFYGIRPRYLPSNSWWQAGDYAAFEPGIYCISATLLQQVYLLPLSRWTPQLESLYQMALPRIEQLQRHQFVPTAASGDATPLPDEIVRRIRFGRLCAVLRERQPDDAVGYSILIYFLKAEDIDSALRGPPLPMANESADDLATIAEELAVAGLTDIPEELYRKALRDLPNDDHCHKNLGLILNRQGRHAEAAAEFEAAVRLNPRSAEALNNLAAMYVKLGRTDEAISHYQHAVLLRRNWPEAHANLAGLYANKGELPNAIAHYEEALRLYPHWPIMHVNLGNALAKLGRLDDAIRAFEKSLQLQPDLQKAKDGLRQALERKADTTSNTRPPPSH